MVDYSVLMTVYAQDRPDFLRLSIESILNQTQPANDFVIVKDGPLTPELDQVIEAYQDNNPAIQVVPLPYNVGLGAALNAGLSVCRNELVARMDADDIALPERCEKQVQAFYEDPELSIIGGFALEFSTDSEQIDSVKTLPTSPDAIYQYGKRRNPFIHPTVMYRKSVILELGGYSSLRRGQDIELFIRLLHGGYKGRNLPYPVLKFRSSEAMFKRRKSWAASKNYIVNIYKSWKMGYASLFDLALATTLRLINLLIPLSLTKLIYRKILRKSRT